MALTTPPTDPVAALDWRAFDVCQNWFRRHPSDVLECDGVPLGELLRQHLWSKVGRALRLQAYPEAFGFEATWLLRDRVHRTWGIPGRLPAPDRPGLPTAARAMIGQGARRVAHSVTRLRDRRPAILVPHLRVTGTRLVSELQATRAFRVLLFPDRPGASRLAGTGHLPAPVMPPRNLLDGIRSAVLSGLAAEGIDLLDLDRESLDGEIALEWNRVRQYGEVLRRLRPSVLVMPSDDVSPPLTYVYLARRMGIPVISFKHGLDCEHHFLSQAYADAIMVWGRERAERYRAESVHQPRWLHVTGNVEYMGRRPPEHAAPAGSCWLWVTRPHDPMKCFAPSRLPREGLDIFEGLLDLLSLPAHRSARLVIKPHPTDLVEPYRERLKTDGARERVSIVSGSLDQLLPEASLVFAEDSTAAMDAMFHGKPLIHVHFAPSVPVLPIVSYGAGLPGRDRSMLEDSVDRVMAFTGDDWRNLIEGQRAFLADFAGPLDDSQAERSLALVHQVLQEWSGAD